MGLQPGCGHDDSVQPVIRTPDFWKCCNYNYPYSVNTNVFLEGSELRTIATSVPSNSNSNSQCQRAVLLWGARGQLLGNRQLPRWMVRFKCDELRRQLSWEMVPEVLGYICCSRVNPCLHALAQYVELIRIVFAFGDGFPSTVSAFWVNIATRFSVFDGLVGFVATSVTILSVP